MTLLELLESLPGYSEYEKRFEELFAKFDRECGLSLVIRNPEDKSTTDSALFQRIANILEIEKNKREADLKATTAIKARHVYAILENLYKNFSELRFQWNLSGFTEYYVLDERLRDLEATVAAENVEKAARAAESKEYRGKTTAPPVEVALGTTLTIGSQKLTLTQTAKRLPSDGTILNLTGELSATKEQPTDTKKTPLNNAIMKADGTLLMPDGVIRKADGSIVYPNRPAVGADGREIPFQKIHKNHPQYIAAILLLGTDPSLFEPILDTTNTESSQYNVNIADLIENDFPEGMFSNMGSCTEYTIREPVQQTDSILQKLQKRLYAAGVHVDAMGVGMAAIPAGESGGDLKGVKRDLLSPTRRRIGSDGAFHGASNESLISGISYEVVLSYLRFIHQLTKKFDQQLALARSLEEEYLGDKPIQKYKPFLDKLDRKDYQETDFKRLCEILVTPNKLCEAVIDDKVIGTAFFNVDIARMRNLLPDSQLFPLAMFMHRPTSERITTIWRDASQLEAVIKNFPPKEPQALVSYLATVDDKQGKILNLIKGFPKYFRPGFIFEFVDKNFSDNERVNHLRDIITAQVRQYGSQLVWLESLKFHDSNAILNIMKKYNFPIDVDNLLKLGSNKLKATDVLSALIVPVTILPVKPVSVQPVVSVSIAAALAEPPKVTKEDAKEVVIEPAILPAVAIPDIRNLKILKKEQVFIDGQFVTSEQIKAFAKTEFKDYETKNLTKKGQNNYENKYFVPAGRAVAYGKITRIIDDKNKDLSELIALSRKETFRDEVGFYDETMYVNPRYSLWGHLNKVLDKCSERQRFFMNTFTDPKKLTWIISNNQYYSKLTKSELALIFNYCYFNQRPESANNRLLFLELMKKYNRLDSFDALPGEFAFYNGNKKQGFVLSKAKMEAMLDSSSPHCAEYRADFDILPKGLAKTAKVDARTTISVPVASRIKVPDGYKAPGITVGRENLTPDLLYQMTEADLGVAETYLVRQYKPVLRNQIAEIKVDEKAVSPSTTEFFHVPTSLTPDPESKDFASALQSLIKSHVIDEKSSGQRSVIFSGILNYGKNHYIPYFIYKKSATDLQIIFVDPSPQTRQGAQDPKRIVYEKLKNSFQNKIFSEFKCTFQDPNVTQQIRQRDCGYNALTVLEDAYSSAAKPNPLVRVNETGNLIIDPMQLSVNCNGDDMRVYDQRHDMYFYSPLATERTEANRQVWARRLFRAQEGHQIAKDTGQWNMNAAFSLFPMGDYDYEHNYNDQYTRDAVGVAYGELATKIADISRIQYHFATSLAAPSDEAVSQFIDSLTPTDRNRFAEQLGDLHEAVRYVIDLNLSDYYPEAIFNYFSIYLREQNAVNVSDQNDARKLMGVVDRYIAEPKVKVYFDKITPKRKLEVQAALSERIRHVIEEKIRQEFEEAKSTLRTKMQSAASLAEIKSLVESKGAGADDKLGLPVDDKLTSYVEELAEARIKELCLAQIKQLPDMKPEEAAEIIRTKNVGNRLDEIDATFNAISSLRVTQKVRPKLKDWYIEHLQTKLGNNLSVIFPLIYENAKLLRLGYNDSIYSEEVVKEAIAILRKNTTIAKTPEQKSVLDLLAPDEKAETSKPNPYLAGLTRAYLQDKNKYADINMFLGKLQGCQDLLFTYQKALAEFSSLDSSKEALALKTPDTRAKGTVGFGFDELTQIANILKTMTEIRLTIEGVRTEPSATQKELLESQATILQQQMTQFMGKIVVKNYDKGVGAVRFDSFIPRLRKLLCQMLNIPNTLTDGRLPAHLNTDQALKIDQAIQNYIIKNDYKDVKVVPFDGRMPCYVKAAKGVPDIKDKSVTPKLLTQLASNWALACEAKESASEGLNKLFAALNNISPDVEDDAKLSDSWCTRWINRITESLVIREEMNKNPLTKQFVEALSNLKFKRVEKVQAVSTNRNIKPISILDIESIIKARESSSADLSKNYQRFMRGVDRSSTVRGWFQSKDTLKDIEAMIKLMRARHAKPTGDFALTEGDFTLMREVHARMTKDISSSDDDSLIHAYDMLGKFVSSDSAKNLVTAPVVQRSTAASAAANAAARRSMKK